MPRTYTKILHFLLSTALINSSLQPVYALVPENENEVVREAKGHSYVSHCNNVSYGENKASTTAQSWAPHFIKDLASKASTKIASLLGNQQNQDVDSFVEYVKDDFQDEIETLKIYKPNKYTLTQLQNKVWDGEISPYQYVKGLQELEPFVTKKLLKKVQDKFESKLDSFFLLVDWNLRKELTSFLKNTNNPQQLDEDFESLLAYYGRVQNPLDYTETLVGFLRFIQKNKVSLALTDESYTGLKRNIVKAVNKRDQEKYRVLKRQRQFSQAALQALPFYGEDLSNNIFNSSLPISQKMKEETAGTSFVMTVAKNIAQGAYNGLKYTLEHPGQAITLGLAGHVLATAATLSEFNRGTSDNRFRSDSIASFSRQGVRAIGNEFQINQNTALDQVQPVVAGLNNGNAFVAWTSIDYQASSSYIYGRLFAANGMPTHDEFGITQSGTSQANPSVAALSGGNVFVAWNDLRTGDFNIYGRIFATAGYVLSNDFIINQVTTAGQIDPSIAALSDGNAFVVWSGDQAGNPDIYGRVFFPNGTALGNEFTINQNTALYQNFPSVASLLDGNIFVVWKGNQEGYNIYGRIFSPSGVPLSSEFSISQNTTSSKENHFITGLNDGNVFVVWDDSQTAIPDIYGRFFSANGAALGPEFIVNQNTTFEQKSPCTVGLKNGNVFVAWEGFQNGHDLYGRLFSSTGTALGSEFSINQITNPTGNAMQCFVAALNNENVFVSWTGGQSGNADVYGRIFGSETPGITSTTGTTGMTATLGTTQFQTTAASMTSLTSMSTTQGTTGSSATGRMTTRGSASLSSTSPLSTSGSSTTSAFSNANKLMPQWLLFPARVIAKSVESLWNMARSIE